jgi:hypothetical protein
MLLQYTCTIKSDNNPSICFFQSQPALDAVSLAAVLNDTLNMDYIIDMHKRSLNSLVWNYLAAMYIHTTYNPVPFG